MATLPQVIPSLSSSTAIITPGAASQAVSFSALHKQVNTVRSFLASLALPPQSAIAIALPNSLEFAIAFFAVTYSGFVAAPLNPALRQSEFEFYLQDLKCPVAFVTKDENEAVVNAARKIGKFVEGGSVRIFTVAGDDGVTVSRLDGQEAVVTGWKGKVQDAKAEDVALVLHTSGTTGRPKVVPLTHLNLTTSIRNIVQTYRLGQSDTGLLVMPLFHVHGLLCGFLAPLSVSAAVVVPARFSASSFWPDFVEHKATWYTAVPTIHQILLKSAAPEPVPKIRFIRSCSSALAPSTMRSLEARFHAPVVEAYAMTEASHQMTSNELPPGQRKPASVGKPQGSVSIKILDQDGNEVGQGREGEICVKGGNVTTGYHNNKAANESSFTTTGYFRTGDQGKVDEDGFVFITGRIKELINRGGEKISPVELDGVLLEHPAVAEAVSFAVPDDMYGQEVHAAVVLKPDGAQASEHDIKDFMAKRVAKFKVPKKIYFTKVMPKTATGKIQRKNIADTFFRPQGKANL
ncbi:hypothetical protein POJ06DRAFT_192552 [Lipomyces tetrasporus]|uniref:Peroxisomal-coenzyme A synthetase n=1 Tax=Lipomyces tetrasporus TaxID=54092 RepID=A0AAD7R0D4_9ASCO|nr:uncharacterized protein POJ06DRAFT_192552 [Lipomyces tetrasporus]KAJ8103232.1 hypothetical protein POJ06DRAFT_192552 [Lipomyces tetrasporus]